MNRILVLAVVAAAAALVVAAVNAGTQRSRQHVVTRWVIDHSDTDVTSDIGKKGDSAGDVLTFHNDVYDRANTKKIGLDHGFCVRTQPGKSYECYWTTFLPEGQITVEGPSFDAGPSKIAVTGGTGAYRNARGYMDLRARNKAQTRFDLVFHLTVD